MCVTGKASCSVMNIIRAGKLLMVLVFLKLDVKQVTTGFRGLR